MRTAPQAQTTDTKLRIGGEFLKPPEVRRLLPILKGPDARETDFLVTVIEDRPTNRENAENGITGPAEGQFGMDIPIHLNKRSYIVTVPMKFGSDYPRLLRVFGDDLDKWVGRNVAIVLDPESGYIVVAPVGEGDDETTVDPVSVVVTPTAAPAKARKAKK